MQIAPTELARRFATGVAYATQPARLSLSLPTVVTRDGHELQVAADVAVRLVDREADRELFDERFPGPVVTLDAVRHVLTPRLAEATATFAQQHDAQQAVGHQTILAELILARLNEIGFGCGLEFLPPIDVTLHCPSLEADRAAARAARQQLRDLDHAAEVLARLSTTDPARLPPGEQATALQLLLRQAGFGTFYVAAGEKLLRFAGDAPPETILHSADIGPFRSIRQAHVNDTHLLLVGGQRGMLVWTMADARADDSALASASPVAFSFQASSDRGFNSAAIDGAGRVLYAAHTEVGLARWVLDSAEPLPPLATPGHARHLTAIDERLVCAAGSAVCVIDAAGLRVAADGVAMIVGLHVTGNEVVVVRADGVIDRLDRSTLAPISRFHRGQAIHCSAMLCATGLTAFAIAGEGPIDVVNPAGHVLFELHGLPGPRMLAAAGRHVVAVAADRQRLAVWQADRPALPARVYAVTAMVQSRIADVIGNTLQETLKAAP